MRFAVKDHLAEAIPFVTALTAAGHEFSPDGPTDLFLTDLDCDKFGYREFIDFYRECGAVVLQYPHGAPASTLQYDCLYDPYDQVDGQLTTGQGEIDFLRSIGIYRPARIVGWNLCSQFEFRATEKPRRIVFAPTHVNADGGLDRERMATNREVFRALVKGVWAYDWELIVRYVGDLERCGLWNDQRVFRYVVGDRDMSTVEIDVADCVVAGAGTYPCLAIARGVPSIMYGQFSGAMYGLPDEVPVPLRNLEKYHDLVAYPYDAYEFGRDMPELIYHVCREERPELVNWRDRWIGRPFDPAEFVRMVERWVPELQAARPVPA